jgi:hypothetical protein
MDYFLVRGVVELASEMNNRHSRLAFMFVGLCPVLVVDVEYNDVSCEEVLVMHDVLVRVMLLRWARRGGSRR